MTSISLRACQHACLPVCVFASMHVWQFLLSLSSADLTVGLAYGIYLSMTYTGFFELYTHQATRFVLCVLRTALMDVTLVVSVTNLLSITIDRWIAICHPLRYPTIVTDRRANAAIGATWLWAVLFVVVPLLLWHSTEAICSIEVFFNRYHMLAQCIYLLLLLAAMAALYADIARVAKRHRQSIHARPSEEPAAMRRHHALATTRIFALVFGALVACVTPFYGVYTYLAMRGLDYTAPGFYWPTWLADVLWVANSWVNPAIYCWKYADFRRALRTLLRREG
ncbi:PREDICTED: histamine H2 receptor-like [Priapulus caudatus]|uniref:Histamine H2 receptor-like n=1 Tax=Priapulus caudatus TaxID=37621 RepID=A0ABM1EBI3_PRICU|nr:PREDICTED: histamine H2 receptor-like [Priapulus caudatus]